MDSISQNTQRFPTFEKLTTQWHRCPSLGSIPDQYVLVFHSVQHHIPTEKLMKPKYVKLTYNQFPHIRYSPNLGFPGPSHDFPDFNLKQV